MDDKREKNPDEIEITYYISNNSQNKLHATDIGKCTRVLIRTTYIFFQKKSARACIFGKKVVILHDISENGFSGTV